MRAAFNLFDKDGGGTIDASEIAHILGQNAAADDQVWEEVIREVDTNGDGQIDFDEFYVMMTKLADKQGTVASHRDSIALASAENGAD